MYKRQSAGDSPKIVIAAGTIEECFLFLILARRLAVAFRGPVLVLTDANLATGVQPIPRPQLREEWLSPPVDLAPWDQDVKPYDWNPTTGVSPRSVPGQPGGEYVLTGHTHTRDSHVAYDPESQQMSCEMRSRKLAALRSTLRPPRLHGDETGDLLVVGWGSTLGAIEEAVDRARAEGHSVTSCHLRFLCPLEPGLEDIFARFRKVMTVELNYSDPRGDFGGPGEKGRPAQLAQLLRGQTLHPVDYWSVVRGQPLSPGEIYDMLVERLQAIEGTPRVPSVAGSEAT